MKIRQRLGLVAAVLLINFAAAGTAMADGQRGPRPTGVYLADIVIETIGPWDCQFLLDLGFVSNCVGEVLLTLHADGTAESNDQNDFENGFEGLAQGTWVENRDGVRLVTIRSLSLAYDPTGLPEAYRLRELIVGFSADADQFSGSFENNNFASTQDPLDPLAVPNVVVTGTVIGRRFQ